MTFQLGHREHILSRKAHSVPSGRTRPCRCSRRRSRRRARWSVGEIQESQRPNIFNISGTESECFQNLCLPLGNAGGVLGGAAGNELGLVVVHEVLEDWGRNSGKSVPHYIGYLPEGHCKEGHCKCDFSEFAPGRCFSSHRMALLRVTPYLSRNAWSTSGVTRFKIRFRSSSLRQERLLHLCTPLH